MDKYKIGIYLRLSMKDRGYIDESNSIKTQYAMINDYIDSKSEFQHSSRTIYCDDGFTGTNFNRPKVAKMLDDAKNGKINCVIVKDISRFGRNYIEVGNYLEKIFPFLNVRFIAISDEYDSINTNDVGSLMPAFKSVFADIYSKELSIKIKSAMTRYAHEGQYMSGSTPYGYRKEKNNRRKIVVDDNVSEVIKWIFNEALNGKNTTEIAQCLNAMNIVAPKVYKNQITPNAKKIDRNTIWTSSSVYCILKNQTYTGDYIFNKSYRQTVGTNSPTFTDRKDWVIIENNHEAIIDKETFYAVNMKYSNKNKKSRTHKHKSTSTLNIRCGHCNRKLIKTKSELPQYYCPSSKFIEETECNSIKATKDKLDKIIISSCQIYLKSMIDTKAILEAEPLNAKIKLLKSNYDKQHKDSLKWSKRLQDLLNDNFDGKISDESFKSQSALIESQRASIENEMNFLNEKINNLINKETADAAFLTFFSQFDNISKISEEIMLKLIDEVIVLNSTNIQIKWAYKDPFGA